MPDELDKCKHCGGEAKVVVCTPTIFDPFPFCVRCLACGLSTQTFTTEAETVAAWNRRAGSPESEQIAQLTRERDELAAALEKVKSTCDDEENNKRGIGIDSPLIEYIFKGRKFAARNIRKCIVGPSAILAERDAKLRLAVSAEVRELVRAGRK